MDCSTPGYPVLHCLPVCSNSGPVNLSQWCYLTISSSATFFSFCPQSFPASGSFPISRLFTLGGQNIGTSASASVLPMSIQGWFPLGLIDILAVQATLKSLLQHYSLKASILWHSAFFMVQLSHPYMTTGKTLALTRWVFAGKVVSLQGSEGLTSPQRTTSCVGLQEPTASCY